MEAREKRGLKKVCGWREARRWRRGRRGVGSPIVVSRCRFISNYSERWKEGRTSKKVGSNGFAIPTLTSSIPTSSVPTIPPRAPGLTSLTALLSTSTVPFLSAFHASQTHPLASPAVPPCCASTSERGAKHAR